MLEKDLSDWLFTFNSSSIQFRNPYQAIIGLPAGAFRSDGMLATDDILLAVEVEAGQIHADTNVGKYWFLHKKYKPYKKIVLFHIYTPSFNSYGWYKELAEFYSEQMKQQGVPIEYSVLDYRSFMDYNRVLMEIKSKVQERIRSEFGVT